MKRSYTIAGAAMLAGFLMLGIVPAHAGNSAVEATMRGYGDLSMFYQGLLNTGVINNLNENQRYTIFAPVNRAFVRINRQTYPCFYEVGCRPQIASVLRNHILVGAYPLQDLVTYGGGIRAMSGRLIHVDEAYVGDYTVDGYKVLSTSEVDGNIIYRIDGVIATPQELSPFTTVKYVPPASTVTTEKIIRRTYRTPAALPNAYPAGGMAGPYSGDNASQTTTIIRTREEP